MNKRLLKLFLLMFLVQISFAQSKLTDKIPVNKDIKIGKLSNGLTYYILKNAKPEKKAELRVVINTGSIMEDEDQQGLAHFMEHMNFNGSKHYPGNQLVEYLQSIGIKFGADLNAYTAFDETVYILPIPVTDPKIVENGFKVIEDWAGNALLDPKEIDQERGIIIEEMRTGKGAADRMRQKYFPKLFNGSKYADRLPIGKEDLLKTFSYDAIRRYYKEWYRPNLEAVIVVGDIDVAEMEAKIKNHFSHFTNPANARQRPEVITINERKQAEAMVVTDKETSKTSVQVLQYIRRSKPTVTLKDYRDGIIEGLFSAMLNKRLGELTQLPNPPYLGASASKSGFQRGYETFGMYATVGAAGTEKAIQAVTTELERAKRFGFTATELDRAKKNFMAAMDGIYAEREKTESSAFVGELISNFLSKEPIPGIEWEYKFVKDYLPGITLAEVNAMKKEFTQAGSKPFVLVMGPDNEQTKSLTQNGLLAALTTASTSEIRPYEEKAIASSLLDKEPVAGKIVKEEKNEEFGFTKFTFDNGVTVTLKPTDFKNDEIIMSAVRFGGSSLYGVEDKENTANLAAIVGTMGYGKFSPIDMNNFMSGKMAGASVSFGELTEGVNGSSNKKDFEIMLQSVYLKMTSPRRDDALFQSLLTKQKAAMQNMNNNPDVAFRDSVLKTIYQENPYAPRVPKIADLDKINVNRILEIYRERFGNAYGMNFVFTGSFDINEVKPLLEKYIGSLPSKPRELAYKDLGLRYKQGNIEKDVYAGTEPKSQVLVIFSGKANYNDAERMKFDALTEVAQIIVTEKIREELGSAYSPSLGGSLSKLPYENYVIQAAIGCAPENVEKVVNAVKTIAKQLQEKGTTEEELQKVKENWKNQHKVSIKTNGYWLGKLIATYTTGYDLNSINTFDNRVDALSTADIKEAAKEFFGTDNVIRIAQFPEK